MTQLVPKKIKQLIAEPERMLNKAFYRFLFSFIAVIASVLLFILVLGAGNQV